MSHEEQIIATLSTLAEQQKQLIALQTEALELQKQTAERYLSDTEAYKNNIATQSNRDKAKDWIQYALFAFIVYYLFKFVVFS